MPTEIFIIAVCGMATPILILAIIFYYTHLSEQRFHETLQKLIESGQEISEEAISGIPGYKKVMPRDDSRNGTMAVGVGIGLFLFGFVSLGKFFMGVGLLVATIGATMVYYHRKNQTNKSTDLAVSE